MESLGTIFAKATHQQLVEIHAFGHTRAPVNLDRGPEINDQPEPRSIVELPRFRGSKIDKACQSIEMLGFSSRRDGDLGSLTELGP